ncbi:MAG: TetR/AcrR family transcriptional regulator [Acidimicrobiales bacterium]
MSTAQRMSADERREEVLRAAAAAFADGGYQGTTTQDVAERAGISQPYIFRLFSSKKELFLAVVEDCFKRTDRTFAKAAEGLSGDEALHAMGMAYVELIRDPVNLLVQMHCFTAAAGDPEIRLVAQRGMRKVWETAARASGAGDEALRSWIAMGMLCNMVCALGIEELDEPWAKQMVPSDKADH